jgi:hypothetical protein
MRLQFATLLADIGLIDLPKDTLVCLFKRIDLDSRNPLTCKVPLSPLAGLLK